MPLPRPQPCAADFHEHLSSEGDKTTNERQRARYEADFDPGFTSKRILTPTARLAAAAEYTAFQLGQINRKLDRLTAAVERLVSSQLDPRPFS
jgi:hypothetical protein